MEYCIYLLVETLNEAIFDPKESKIPIETAWGFADKPEKHYFTWSRDYRVEVSPKHTYLSNYISGEVLSKDWIYLFISGNGIVNFNRLVYKYDNGEDAFESEGAVVCSSYRVTPENPLKDLYSKEQMDEIFAHPFLRILTILLKDQKRWVAVFEKHCDEINKVYYHSTLQELLETVILVYSHLENEHGFCSVFAS